MTITNLDEYKTQVQGKDFLGRVVFFCQRDAVIDYTLLRDALDEAGLLDFCPRRPGAIDVFRRVSTSAQRSRLDVGDGKYVNVLIRDVSNDPEKLLRKVVVETVDAKGETLDFSERYNLVFDRTTMDFTATPLQFSSSPADDVVAAIRANFSRLRNTVDSGAVRALVARVLKANHSISARPTGGADFLPEKHAAVVDALETLPGKVPGCWIHSIPLIDDAKQRSYVKAQAQDDIAAEVDSALNEMRKLLTAGDTISAAKFAAINTTFKQNQARLDTFRDLLGEQLDGTKARLDIYGLTMAALAQQVKVAA